jgi:hypothetical protein
MNTFNCAVDDTGSHGGIILDYNSKKDDSVLVFKGDGVSVDTNGDLVFTDTDTGATSIEVTGTGNAITGASYNASARKITLTKGATYNNYSLSPATTSTLGGIIVAGSSASSINTTQTAVASRYYGV